MNIRAVWEGQCNIVRKRSGEGKKKKKNKREKKKEENGLFVSRKEKRKEFFKKSLVCFTYLLMLSLPWSHAKELGTYLLIFFYLSFENWKYLSFTLLLYSLLLLLQCEQIQLTIHNVQYEEINQLRQLLKVGMVLLWTGYWWVYINYLFRRTHTHTSLLKSPIRCVGGVGREKSVDYTQLILYLFFSQRNYLF